MLFDFYCKVRKYKHYPDIDIRDIRYRKETKEQMDRSDFSVGECFDGLCDIVDLEPGLYSVRCCGSVYTMQQCTMDGTDYDTEYAITELKIKRLKE